MKAYWDSDYYEIYMYNEAFTGNKKKWIRVEGFYYDNGEDNGHGTSREELYSGFDLPLEEFLSEPFDYDIFQEQLTHYVEDMEPSEAERRMTEFGEYKPLSYKKLTMETPCGKYVDVE